MKARNQSGRKDSGHVPTSSASFHLPHVSESLFVLFYISLSNERKDYPNRKSFNNSVEKFPWTTMGIRTRTREKHTDILRRNKNGTRKCSAVLPIPKSLPLTSSSPSSSMTTLNYPEFNNKRREFFVSLIVHPRRLLLLIVLLYHSPLLLLPLLSFRVLLLCRGTIIPVGSGCRKNKRIPLILWGGKSIKDLCSTIALFSA